MESFDFSTPVVAERTKYPTFNFEPTNANAKTTDKFSFVRLNENLKFSDLAEKMSPICVEGLEHITGVLGRVEDVSEESDDKSKKSEKFNMTGKPMEGALLWAHIAFFLEGKAKPYESTYVRRTEMILRLDDWTLPGIVVACRSLYPGQCGQFLLPPHTMHGESGSCKVVPKSATILMVVKFSRWVDAGAIHRYEKLDDSSKKKFTTVQSIIENLNEAAGCYFIKKIYNIAIEIYEKINDLLNNLDIDLFHQEIEKCKIRNFVNMAICYNCIEKPYIAINCLDQASVLENCNENCKYLYTRGKSHALIQEHELALNFLTSALNIEPNNVEIGNELLKLDALMSKHKHVITSIAKNMCKSLNSNSESDEVQDGELLKNVTDLCEYLKSSSIACFPFPPCLLHKEEIKLEAIIKNIDDVKVVLQKLLHGKIQRNITIEKNT